MVEMDEVAKAYERCKSLGFHISMSVGQHANDRAVSFYVRTPSGFDIECGWNPLTVPEEGWKGHPHLVEPRGQLGRHRSLQPAELPTPVTGDVPLPFAAPVPSAGCCDRDVLLARRQPVIHETRGSRPRQPESPIHPAQQQQATVAGEVAAAERRLDLAASNLAETNPLPRYTLALAVPLVRVLELTLNTNDNAIAKGPDDLMLVKYPG